MDELEIRPATTADAEAVVDAQREVYGEPADTHAFRLAQRRWAYERNPAGQRSFVALAGGRVVAHYGAWPQRALWAGRPIVLCQAVDSFALPAWQGRGVFVRTARAFFAAHGGAPDAACYGWPVEAAWRVGRRRLGYEVVRDQLALWLDRALRPGTPPAGVDALERFDHQARWLFERCAGAFGLAVVRDAEHLTWRFLERPCAGYRCLGASDGEGTLRGLAVLAPSSRLVPGAAALVDWLVPDGEPEVGEALLAACEHEAAAAGASGLFAWLPTWSPWFVRLQERGYRVAPTSYLLGVRPFARRLDADLLRTAWWSTLADSDLV